MPALGFEVDSFENIPNFVYFFLLRNLAFLVTLLDYIPEAVVEVIVDAVTDRGGVLFLFQPHQ